MSVKIPVRQADHIRLLAERYPDLDTRALAEKGGWEHSHVRGALTRRRPDKPKSRLA